MVYYLRKSQTNLGACLLQAQAWCVLKVRLLDIHKCEHDDQQVNHIHDQKFSADNVRAHVDLITSNILY